MERGVSLSMLLWMLWAAIVATVCSLWWNAFLIADLAAEKQMYGSW